MTNAARTKSALAMVIGVVSRMISLLGCSAAIPLKAGPALPRSEPTMLRSNRMVGTSFPIT